MFVFAVPIDKTEGIHMLYVFVDIKIDIVHFLETIRFNFEAGSHIALVSTIQFVPALQVSLEQRLPFILLVNLKNKEKIEQGFVATKIGTWQLKKFILT